MIEDPLINVTQGPFVLSFLFAAALAFADELAPRPDARVRHFPSAERHAAWSETLFEQDTLWTFADEDQFDDLMDRARVPAAQARALRDRVTDDLAHHEFDRAKSFVDVPVPALYLWLSEAQWDALPARLIREYYADQFRRDERDGLFFQLFRWRWSKHLSRAALRRRWRPYAKDAAAAAAMARASFDFDGRHYVPVVAATWRHLNPTMRGLAVDSFTDDHPARWGLALDRLPPLPPFLRERVGTYAACSGANCFNAGVNLLSPPGTPEGSTDHREVERHLHEHYRPLEPGETTSPGDLMIYRRPWYPGGPFEVFNASVCVAPGQIFVKNGLSKFCPYVVDDLIKDYVENQREGPFTMTVYRHLDPHAYARACDASLR